MKENCRSQRTRPLRGARPTAKARVVIRDAENHYLATISVYGLSPQEISRLVVDVDRAALSKFFANSALAGRSGGATGGPPTTGGEAGAMEDASPAGAGLAIKRPAKRSGRTKR